MFFSVFFKLPKRVTNNYNVQFMCVFITNFKWWSVIRVSQHIHYVLFRQITYKFIYRFFYFVVYCITINYKKTYFPIYIFYLFNRNIFIFCLKNIIIKTLNFNHIKNFKLFMLLCKFIKIMITELYINNSIFIVIKFLLAYYFFFCSLDLFKYKKYNYYKYYDYCYYNKNIFFFHI